MDVGDKCRDDDRPDLTVAISSNDNAVGKGVLGVCFT